MPLSLPSRPHLDQLRNQAKDLLAAWRSGDPGALDLLREHHPAHADATAADGLRLADAQLVTARRYGFPSWPRLKTEVELVNMELAGRAERFVRAAVDEAPASAGDWNFSLAKRLLAREPALARAGLHTALVLGDVEIVRRALERDPDLARRKGGPCKDREPLLYVTYSKFHRESLEQAEGLLATARLLLDHGADPDASFVVEPWDNPLRSLCGACGVTNFPAMAELLLDRGATIDDFESLYHSLEHPDTRCLELLLARGANPRGTNALNHAFDRPGTERIRRLLDHGADPNEVIGNDGTPLHVAIQKGRERAVLELLVAHGADVDARRGDGRTPYQVALQHGHREAALYLAEAGAETSLTPFERFADACSRGDLLEARRLATENPGLFESLSEQDRGAFLRIAELGRTEMIVAMVDAGFPSDTARRHRQTALHTASWHGWPDTVEALLARGARVDAVEDEYGGTPLGWAVHGSEVCPNPEADHAGVIRLLLAAGADATDVTLHGETGPVADLLRAAGAKDIED